MDRNPEEMSKTIAAFFDEVCRPEKWETIEGRSGFPVRMEMMLVFQLGSISKQKSWEFFKRWQEELEDLSKERAELMDFKEAVEFQLGAWGWDKGKTVFQSLQDGVHGLKEKLKTPLENNMRTEEEQILWDKERKRWEDARDKLPTLKSQLAKVDGLWSAFDAHSMFKWVDENPEEATICIAEMYEQLRHIWIGQKAASELEFPER